jgi:polysaccharide export outer membrane protein
MVIKLKHQTLFVRQLFFCFSICVVFDSCSSSKKINFNPVYFKAGADTVTAIQKERVIHPFDQLSIQVYSKTPNQEQAAIFNIYTSPVSSIRESLTSAATASGVTGAASSNGVSGSSATLLGYRVNELGNIEMPVIGTINTSGLTIYQLQDYISKKVANYVKDPAVVVHYQNFDVNVLGEVRIPGVKKFAMDQVTVLDAIGASGDLTDFGMRSNVTVIRDEAGKQVFYHVDLRDRSVFKSPVYRLQPNDIVYVSPTNIKLENLDISPTSQRTTTLIFGILGIGLSIATLIVTLSTHH